MVQQLTNGVLDFSSNPDLAIQFLFSRSLHDAVVEMSGIELENFFDNSFYLFDEETPQHEIAEIAIDILDLHHFHSLMAENSNKTVYEMLVAEGFVNTIDCITALSIEYPTK
ncbi:hypothetical protein [Rummeliibacillus sp. POC4]|uniref:hypothetical protein n=1 Tax=Rummeliibacillus sp. POC4 TaxID=2305899 RepID=UPI000E668649|nr:hypothetical protein [Rummeliibacillus sp. POC4]RIJ63129.1 hypothetical protein D1606_16640 [Rummeliibacillus sp. POC4]